MSSHCFSSHRMTYLILSCDIVHTLAETCQLEWMWYRCHHHHSYILVLVVCRVCVFCLTCWCWCWRWGLDDVLMISQWQESLLDVAADFLHDMIDGCPRHSSSAYYCIATWDVVESAAHVTNQRHISIFPCTRFLMSCHAYVPVACVLSDSSLTSCHVAIVINGSNTHMHSDAA